MSIGLSNSQAHFFALTAGVGQTDRRHHKRDPEQAIARSILTEPNGAHCETDHLAWRQAGAAAGAGWKARGAKFSSFVTRFDGSSTTASEKYCRRAYPFRVRLKVARG